MSDNLDRITNRQRRIKDAYELWISGAKNLIEAAEQMHVTVEEILKELRRRSPLRFYRAKLASYVIVTKAIIGWHADNLVSNIRRMTRA